jgi:Skp family chaperone for outer membrane proteins
LVDEYQKNITTWSEIVKQYQEARITKMQQRIEEREDQFEIELKQIEAESIRKSEQIIKQATTNVSAKLALDLVVDSSQTIYFKEKLDITKLVLTEMVKIDQTTK